MSYNRYFVILIIISFICLPSFINTIAKYNQYTIEYYSINNNNNKMKCSIKNYIITDYNQNSNIYMPNCKLTATVNYNFIKNINVNIDCGNMFCDIDNINMCINNTNSTIVYYYYNNFNKFYYCLDKTKNTKRFDMYFNYDGTGSAENMLNKNYKCDYNNHSTYYTENEHMEIINEYVKNINLCVYNMILYIILIPFISIIINMFINFFK